eukprot:SAG31_NODE_1460_length_8241_cov_11.816352_3_plen_105_part_00
MAIWANTVVQHECVQSSCNHCLCHWSPFVRCTATVASTRAHNDSAALLSGPQGWKRVELEVRLEVVHRVRRFARPQRDAPFARHRRRPRRRHGARASRRGNSLP